MLDFDAATHTYRWQGQIVPSVTQVIRRALGDQFARIPSDVLERKRKIGEAAHKACELDSRGELDEATVHPAVLPYLEAWRAFVCEHGAEVIECERAVYSETYGYAGRLDFVLKWYGRDDAQYGLVDFKSGVPGPMAAIQTAAYALLATPFVAPGYGVDRFALQGMPNGRYKLIAYSSPSDWPDFLACLRIFRLKELIGND